VLFSIEANLPNDFLQKFSGRKSWPGGLNIVPTVFLDGARPANT